MKKYAVALRGHYEKTISVYKYVTISVCKKNIEEA